MQLLISLGLPAVRTQAPSSYGAQQPPAGELCAYHIYCRVGEDSGISEPGQEPL